MLTNSQARVSPRFFVSLPLEEQTLEQKDALLVHYNKSVNFLVACFKFVEFSIERIPHNIPNQLRNNFCNLKELCVRFFEAATVLSESLVEGQKHLSRYLF